MSSDTPLGGHGGNSNASKRLHHTQRSLLTQFSLDLLPVLVYGWIKKMDGDGSGERTLIVRGCQTGFHALPEIHAIQRGSLGWSWYLEGSWQFHMAVGDHLCRDFEKPGALFD